MKPLRIGIIGAGQIAESAHIPAYQSLPKYATVAAICDTVQERANQVARRFSIPHVYTDYREMLKAISPDLVSVCVPNQLHYGLVMEALEAGSHVFCEKPPAITLAEAEAMQEKAAKEGLLLSYNFCHRHRGEMKALLQKVREHALGDIYGVEVIAQRRRAIPGWGSFTNKDIQGGGPLIDLGIHMLDAALCLLGYPKPAYVCAGMHDKIGKQGGMGLFGAWKGGDSYTVEDSAFGFVQFENGTTMTVKTSFALHTAQRETTVMNLHLYGNQAGASLSPCMIYSGEAGSFLNETIPFAPVDHIVAGAKNMVLGIWGLEELVVTGENVLLTQKIMNAMYESAEQGRPVCFR